MCKSKAFISNIALKISKCLLWTNNNIMPPFLAKQVTEISTMNRPKLSVAKPPLRIKHAEYSKLKLIDITKLEEDICNSQLYQDLPNDLNMLLDCYNTTLRSLLDDHAPVCSRHVSTRPRLLWFNEDIIQARRDRRKA